MMPEPDPARIVACAEAADFAAWLATHCADWPEVWLKLAKGTGLTWEQAVIEALAWGWIDGVKKSLDATHWLQRFTPRKGQSAWSMKNRTHVEKLIADGRMQLPGLSQVLAAQSDGRWDRAYEGSAGFAVPPDFLAALVMASPQAQAHYATLNRQNLYAIYYRLTSVKRPETRTRKVAEFVAMMERGALFH